MSEYNPFSLKGKTILVTGASSGIGKATAIECSKMGAKLIITGRDKDRLSNTFNCLHDSIENHKMIVADFTNHQQIESLVSEIDGINGAVLSAGRGKTLPIKFATSDKFQELFEVNLFSQVELLRLLIKKKRFLNNSSVVFISSIGGNSKFSPGNSIYGTTKAALSSFIKFCVVEFSPKIRFNGINPGMINTPLINRSTLTKEDKDIDISNYPLKRYGEPEEVAYSAIYLLSDAASWVTGTSLCIDGGISVH
jgi:NAD(P)-dependent dehydrogenase (short-subunit alcohol dehydrogenase family)